MCCSGSAAHSGDRFRLKSESTRSHSVSPSSSAARRACNARGRLTTKGRPPRPRSKATRANPDDRSPNGRPNNARRARTPARYDATTQSAPGGSALLHPAGPNRRGTGECGPIARWAVSALSTPARFFSLPDASASASCSSKLPREAGAPAGESLWQPRDGIQVGDGLGPDVLEDARAERRRDALLDEVGEETGVGALLGEVRRHRAERVPETVVVPVVRHPVGEEVPRRLLRDGASTDLLRGRDPCLGVLVAELARERVEIGHRWSPVSGFALWINGCSSQSRPPPDARIGRLAQSGRRISMRREHTWKQYVPAPASCTTFAAYHPSAV